MAPILLYHEEMQPMTVVKVLEQHFRYKCRQVRKCQADVLLCHEKGQTSSALAFLFLKCGQLPQRSTTMEQFWTRLERCKRLFAKSFVLLQTDAMDDPVVLNEIQLAMGQRAPSVGFFSTTTDAISMAQLLVHLRHQHEIQQEEFTIFAFHQIQQQVFTYETALKIAVENFTFLSRDECQILLDVFGSFAILSKCTLDDILSYTVLGQDAAEQLVQFFQTEYICDS